MANRYWVGGTASWDTTAGTKWASTSGGAGGQSVPTVADDVFIDASSGSGTITMVSGAAARSINCTGFTGTLSSATGAGFAIGDATAGAGNVALLFSSTMTVSLGSGTAFFLQSTNSTTQTITTNGKTIQGLTINGSGSNYKFADACTSGGTLGYTAGASIDFNNLTHTFSTFSITGNSNTRNVIFGTAIVNCNLFGGTPFTASGASNVTISASVGAQLNASNGNGPGINLGSLNYGNVAVSHSAASVMTATVTSSGATIYSYTRTGTANKTEVVSFTSGGSLTITNSLNINGNSTTNRILVQAATAGTAFTITNNGTNNISNADFMDITAAGSANWNLSAITGNSGDCLGNTGITFTAGTNLYAVAAGNWSSTSMWSTSSGGSPGARVPLPQDNVFLNASSAAGTYTADMPRMGANIDYTGFTRTFLINGTAVTQYGSVTLSSGMTWTSNGNNAYTFRGRSTHTITTAGKLWRDGGNSTTIAAPGGTYNLQDDWTGTQSGGGFFLLITNGTFNTNNFNLTLASFQSNASTTRVINLGTSTITCTYSTFWNMTATGLTLNASKSTIVLGAPSLISATRIFNGGGLVYGTIDYTLANQTYQLVINGANYIDRLLVGDTRALRFNASTTNTIRDFQFTGTVNGYQYIQATNPSVVTVPDSAALSITGDLDLIARVALNTYTPTAEQVIIAKYSGANSAYALGTSTTGTLQVFTTANANSTGTVRTNSTVALGWSDGQLGWVRATRRASDGRWQFFKSTDNTNNPAAVTWTQLGTNVTNTTAIADTTAPVEIGSYATGSSPAVGKYYRVQIRNNILNDGTGIQLDVDFTAKAWGANTFTEGSSNAATVTLSGASMQAGDGRALIDSSTAGTSAYIDLVGPPPTLDYQCIQDLYAGIPYKYYAGANSLSVSNTNNITFAAAPSSPGIYINRQFESTGSSTSSTLTLPFSQSATAGNLLVICYAALTNPGTVTTPAGYTLVDTSNATNAGYTNIWYKIATGGETGFTISNSSSASSALKFIEVTGFVSTPTVDIKEKNNSAGSSVTSLATGSGVSNTSTTGYAFGFWGYNASPGATISITNNFLECRASTQSSALRTFGTPVTSIGSRTSTFTWTTSGRSSSQLVVFGDAGTLAVRTLSLLGVGT